jgi:hypothetical protein
MPTQGCNDEEMKAVLLVLTQDPSIPPLPMASESATYTAFEGWNPFPETLLLVQSWDVSDATELHAVAQQHHYVNARSMFYLSIEPELASKANPAYTPRGVFVTYNQPLTPADADEYHRWYSQQHLPDVLACPSFIRAQRFGITGVSLSPSPWVTTLEYMNIYEHSCETVEEYNDAFAHVRAGIASGKIQMTSTLTPGAPTSAYGHRA